MCSDAVMQQVRTTASRRRFLGMAAAAAAAAAVPIPAAAATSRTSHTFPTSYAVQDLTHTTFPGFPVFPGFLSVEIQPVVTIAANGFFANRVVYNTEHTGTHLDAPAHFVEGAPTADQLDPSLFVAPLAVIDIADRAAQDADAQVTPDDIRAWEQQHGRLPGGSIVAMYSGWESRVGNADAYLNMDSSGTMHFPGFQPDTAAFLVEEREIVGIGVDTLSLDFGASTDFGSHVTVLGAGKYGIENLANLGTIPPVGVTVIVGAPKHATASGGPTRVFAFSLDSG